MHVAVISARRPTAPAGMAEHLAGLPAATWYVAEGEGDAYREGGAANVVEAGSLCRARNVALDAAADRHCLQLSDDLRAAGLLVARGKGYAVERIPLAELVTLLADVLAGVPNAHLAGIAPTFNAYYGKLGVTTRHFIVGDLMLIAPGPVRFDEGLQLKEDYDFTCRHLAAYGAVARADFLLADFRHRDNPGGAVAYRTPTAEREAIARLRAAWPGVIQPNPRRLREVLLRWPK